MRIESKSWTFTSFDLFFIFTTATSDSLNSFSNYFFSSFNKTDTDFHKTLNKETNC